MLPITEVASKLDIPAHSLRLWGGDMAKIDLAALNQAAGRAGASKLVLVSAITPTPAGEGKTTTTIGVGDALSRLGKRVCVALREPSLGPCFGIKGGGTGGGRAMLTPSDRINLHFTGDFHALTSAHNLIAALLDNHIHFQSALGIDPRRVTWPRVLDVNDRALRRVVLGLGGRLSGMPREATFDITAASELMAILCLAEGFDDLRERVDRIIVAYTGQGEPVTVGQLGATGSALALLRDALHPNLVQTLEGTPAIVHGGPFANIAHGCNSVLATRMALHHADIVITEAGFGFDLGAEKFFDIKCRVAGLNPSAVVLVASARALKMHGGRAVGELGEPDAGAVERGLANLDKHIESVKAFNKTAVVALNRFGTDTDDEVNVVRRHCESMGVSFAIAEHFGKGGEGAIELAERVMEEVKGPPGDLRPVYPLDASFPDKIRAVAKTVYGARDIVITKKAHKQIEHANKLGLSHLPICIAKTQNSLSDDPSLRGRPTDFTVTVADLQINAGAGFAVVLTGDIIRMPGLPRKPQAENIDLTGSEIMNLK